MFLNRLLRSMMHRPTIRQTVAMAPWPRGSETGVWSGSSRKTQGNGLYNTYEISFAVPGDISGRPTVGLNHKVIGVNSFGIIREPQAFTSSEHRRCSRC